MSTLRRRPFQTLLISLVLLLLLYPVLHDLGAELLLFDALGTLVFLAAFRVIFTERRLRRPAVLLGLPTLVGAWTGYVVPGLARVPVAAGFHALAALFLAFTIATVLRNVYTAKDVSADSIYAALCGYLLAGLAFGHLYCLVELVTPGGAFRGSQELTAQLGEEGSQLSLLSYFSFVTLTTLGYGDITPATGAARGLVIVEAVLGQFYVAVLIAELVGRRVAQAVTDRRPDSGS
jgi:hypothetical protein